METKVIQNDKQLTKIMRKIKYFPITSFAAIMGLSGYTILLSKLYHMRLIPEMPFNVMLFFTLFMFGICVLGYGLKSAFFYEEVKKDYNHKIRINFSATFSISLLLLSIALMGKYPIASLNFWILGVVIHTILLFKILNKWITHDFDIHHFNPAWYIPVVGAILIPVAGVNFINKTFLLFYLATGLFFWIILTSILLYRLIFHDELPEKLKPTFFIIVAPPAVGFISYMRLFSSWDFISQSLIMMTYFFVILIYTLRSKFKKMNFFMSWWAFVFPLASVSIASFVAFMVTKKNLYYYAIIGFSVITTIITLLVLYNTFKNIIKGNICVKED